MYSNYLISIFFIQQNSPTRERKQPQNDDNDGEPALSFISEAKESIKGCRCSLNEIKSSKKRKPSKPVIIDLYFVPYLFNKEQYYTLVVFCNVGPM